MLEIRTDISSLTKDQREQLAGFILTFDMAKQQTLPFSEPGIIVTEHDGSVWQEIVDKGEREAQVDNEKALAEIIPTAEETEAAENFFAAPVVSSSDIVQVSVPLPPVPPPPPAPAISQAGPHLVVGSAPEVDASGAPWNATIHSSSKALTAKGLWRTKRGVADREVTPFAAPPPPPLTVQQAAPPPPPPTNLPTADFRLLYVKLIGITSAAVGANKVAKEEFNAVADSLGVPSIALAINSPDKIQSILDACQALIESRG